MHGELGRVTGMGVDGGCCQGRTDEERASATRAMGQVTLGGGIWIAVGMRITCSTIAVVMSSLDQPNVGVARAQGPHGLSENVLMSSRSQVRGGTTRPNRSHRTRRRATSGGKDGRHQGEGRRVVWR